MDRSTRTPVIGRQTRAPAKARQVEPGPTPVPMGDDEDDDREVGWLASVVPAPLRPAAGHVEDLGIWLLGGTGGLAMALLYAGVTFCVWYTLLHGFFGVSWCFGQAGHPPEKQGLPPYPEQPGPFSSQRAADKAKAE